MEVLNYSLSAPMQFNRNQYRDTPHLPQHPDSVKISLVPEWKQSVAQLCTEAK